MDAGQDRELERQIRDSWREGRSMKALASGID
jgi:hypothetical protein